ncbi:hypothetical protein Ciccas_005286 [Cichlidogyrus casuarinus]|uniref:3'(2'),5'-bisphosphate nucleotidase 1 n=1 Tax=Cichlidogyrus casuarinus TaxID=1844966 RepID=A0ABD2Q9A6_9PLAT
MDSPFIIRLLASSVSCTKKASEIVRQVMKTGTLETVSKGFQDYQTKADRDAQKLIVSSLEHNFPLLKIIGEEGALDKLKVEERCLEYCSEVLSKSCPDFLTNITEKETVVWVDPLDGTREFTEGLLPHVTILVGIAVNGKPIAGVICQPFYSNIFTDDPNMPPSSVTLDSTSSRLIWALDGVGVFGIEPKLPASPLSFDNSSETCNIVVTTRSHLTSIVKSSLNNCLPSKVLHIGGCGYKVIKLLEGGAHAYVYASPGCKKWDTCAPEAILRVAGGSLTDVFGKEYDYSSTVPHLNSTGVLATPRSDWLQLYAGRIPDHLRSVLNP